MDSQPEQRKRLVKQLMENPAYLALGARRRLKLIRKIEAGLGLSAARFQMQVWHWIKTGKIG